MFSLLDIKKAHEKVKSGADFPKYIAEIKNLNVSHYETYVTNGKTIYYNNKQLIEDNPTHEELFIENNANLNQFKVDLKRHQQGQTDYLTFCKDCAKCGIEKWVVNLNEMTCIYFDKKRNNVLSETIPSYSLKIE